MRNQPATERELAAVRFVVYGTPAPQGSTRAFFKAGMKRPIVTADNAKTRPWRQQIGATAMALGVQILPKHTPVAITLDFYFAKPPSAPKWRTFPVVIPDLDKLCRSCFDALAGIVYENDAAIVEVSARKHYGQPERCEIVVKGAVTFSDLTDPGKRPDDVSGG